MKEKINIGILGCASIAQRSVIPAICNLKKDFVLLGIASRSQEKAEKFSEEFGTRAFVGYDSLLENSELNAVYIPLPNALHAHWIKRALKKGLHVLVEKPLACTEEDVVCLNKLAKNKRLVLIENFQFRFHNQLDSIKRLVEKGAIGELRCLRSTFGFPPFEDKNNIRYSRDLGGGALLDAGSYPIKISQFFLGEDLEVKAANLFYDTDRKIDIWGGAYLKQNKGDLFSEIAFGFDNFYQCSLELLGTKGRIYTNRIFTAPAGYKPVLELETEFGKEMLALPADDHFKNMLNYFFSLVSSKKDLEQEYMQNVNQARLIAELRNKADEK